MCVLLVCAQHFPETFGEVYSPQVTYDLCCDRIPPPSSHQHMDVVYILVQVMILPPVTLTALLQSCF